jgi:hypothetical protein
VTTNAHSEMGQMAVCCQNLMLCALSVLVGMLFKKVSFFLDLPILLCTVVTTELIKQEYLLSDIPLC